MARITRAAAHVSLEEVKSRLQNDPRAWCRKRWLIIYNALVDPRKAEEIATAGEIQRAFEARVGHEVAESTIYRLLHRHGWRKLMPRPTHPKASREAQEQFKKLCERLAQAAVATRSAEDERPVLQMAQYASPLRPHQSPQTLLGSPWHPASCTLSSGARVCLCLRRCGSLARPDDLIGVAYGQYGDDEHRASSHVSQTLADYFIVMQVDQAGWHRSKELQVPANIRLIAQPAYSPEVNPFSTL
jgi:transposase